MTAPETNSITKGVINKISVEGGAFIPYQEVMLQIM